jgi:DNA-binding response OmpR family regulator
MPGEGGSLDKDPIASGKDVTVNGGVLIMEEDAQIRELLERWLGEAGYVVTTASDGAPRLIIADVAEPQSADERIAALRAVYAAPILLLSARFRRGLGSSADAALRLGVQKVLPKPFTRSELLAAVSESIAP